MISRLLFITEKYCDGNPTVGLSNHFHNLFGSLLSTGITVPEITTMHYDEYTLGTGKHIDGIIVEEVKKINPQLIIFSFLGDHPVNPSIDSIKKLKAEGYYICVIWPDTGYQWALNKIKVLNDIVDLHISWAGEHNLSLANHWWTLTPQDSRIFFPGEQKVDVSFIGSLRGYQDRFVYLNYAGEKGIPVTISGGQREHALSIEQYALAIRSSKINLNFPESPAGIDQCKGRVVETLASKSLLLERANSATKRYFTPGKHYIEFTTPDDMCDKIKYFLEHEDERLEIAELGYLRYQTKYSARAFWETVLTYF